MNLKDRNLSMFILSTHSRYRKSLFDGLKPFQIAKQSDNFYLDRIRSLVYVLKILFSTKNPTNHILSRSTYYIVTSSKRFVVDEKKKGKMR